VCALFLAYEVAGQRTVVVARSVSPFIDAGQLLAAVGGGGYSGAASARAALSADEALLRLESALLATPPPARPVADVMSTPVHVVSPRMPLSLLADALVAWQHTGVPVVDGGRLVGIISRRDVDKARAHGALHLPVAGWMAHGVHTVSPETPLAEALEEMQRHDVGRLPVMRGDELLGIVTRSDLLRLLYGEQPRR
jgi:tRNA nucleotidyltransferase (CCA-adding enzyme)